MCSWEASLGLLVTWARGACGAEEPAGAGPPVLLIMGATGDSGHFHGLVDLLADEYTVVTYDRRGNGRSPRPRGWNTTSNDEQVDDAAALLSSIGLAPAVDFGTRLGAIYALVLLIRHPDAVRGAILHEPPLYGVHDDSEQVLAEMAPQLREAMETGGPPALIERFWRWVAGDSGWEHLEPSLRQRILATADTFCDIERGTYETYRPDRYTRRRSRRCARSAIPARDRSMAGCTSRSPSPAGARRPHPLRRPPARTGTDSATPTTAARRNRSTRLRVAVPGRHSRAIPFWRFRLGSSGGTTKRRRRTA